MEKFEYGHYFRIRMLRSWEDLGRTFRKGKTYFVRKMEIKSVFFTDGYYLIPRSFCRIIERSGHERV